MKYKIGDLFKFADDSGDIAYAIIKDIDKEYYEVHWLDLIGDPNSDYLTHFLEDDLDKWFRKIE